MGCHLQPCLRKDDFQVWVIAGNIVGGMVIEQQVDVQFFGPTYCLVKELIKQRIKGIVGLAAGYIEQIYGQADHITTHAFDIYEILFGIFCELYLV
jgi:hypothetical protein